MTEITPAQELELIDIILSRIENSPGSSASPYYLRRYLERFEETQTLNTFREMESLKLIQRDKSLADTCIPEGHDPYFWYKFTLTGHGLRWLKAGRKWVDKGSK